MRLKTKLPKQDGRVNEDGIFDVPKLGSGEPLQGGEAGSILPDAVLDTSQSEVPTAAAPGPDHLWQIQEEGPPVKVFTSTTPSGLEIEYQSEPKRLYRVNGQEVPSVTTILDVLKKDLSNYGQRIGVEGMLELFRREIIHQNQLDKKIEDAANGEVVYSDLKEFLKQQKLSVSTVVKKASDRGTDIHTALDDWGRTGLKPFVLEYPEEQRGYIDAFNLFLSEADPEPLEVETMVGSAEHGFAGRCDLVARINKTVILRKTPRRDKIEVEPGRYRFDYKSRENPAVYPLTDYRQLAAYEGAAVESGYEPTDAQFIVVLGADGTYQVRRSTADFEDFLSVWEVWHSNKRIPL